MRLVVSLATVTFSIVAGVAASDVRANHPLQAPSVWSQPAVAPGPPGSLAHEVNGSTVLLTWTPPVTGGAPIDYVVQAALFPSGPAIASLATAQTNMIVNAVPNGVYYVRVVARNADGTSAGSNEVTIIVGPPPCTRPGPPTNLAAIVNGNIVTLTWTAPAGACASTTYLVQAGSESGFSNLAVVPVAATTFIATAPPGTYYVRVHAVNNAGISNPSTEIIVSVGSTCIVPGPPSGLIFLISPGPIVTLQWTAPTTGGAPASYLLEAGSAPGLSNLATLNLFSTSFTTSPPRGTYFIRVKAQNACGASVASNEITLIL